MCLLHFMQVRALSANSRSVFTVSLSLLIEQAGLFWYHDDSNYAKLVVEWMKDGTVSIVMAQEVDGASEAQRNTHAHALKMS